VQTQETDEWRALARAVADGVQLRAGDRVSVFLTDYESYPAVHAFCEEAYRRAATPHVVLTDERLERVALEAADVSVLAQAPAIEAASMSIADVHVSFRGMVPPAPGAQPDPARVAAQRTGKGLISTMRWQQTRWALVRVPTVAWARYAGVDPDELRREFLAGCGLDWQAERRSWSRLAERLEATDVVRIVSPDTDLSLAVSGRTAAIFAGEANWPDGEIATAPLEDGVNGFIRFPERFSFASTEFEGLRLEFAAGEVVAIEADRGADVARALLGTDDGARRVGELGIGLNPFMRTWTGDLLLDEKILGTVHIALGRAYPQCGGTNESSLHWDIVKDLRAHSGGGAGTVYFDDEAVIDDGRVLTL